MEANMIRRIETRTSTGMLSKGWYNIKGNKVLVKGNSMYGNKYNYEPYSEVIASRIAGILGVEHVDYALSSAKYFKDIKVRNIEHVSVCKQIPLKRGEQLVTAYNLVGAILGRGSRDYYTDIMHVGADTDKLLQMFMFDAFIGNQDRHLNNWEYIVDSNRRIRLAPIMDNGASLLYNIGTSKLRLGWGIGPDKARPFKDTHQRQVRLLVRNVTCNLFYRMSTDELMTLIERRNADVWNAIEEKRKNSILNYLEHRVGYIQPFM